MTHLYICFHTIRFLIVYIDGWMQIYMDYFDRAKLLTLTRPASEGGKGAGLPRESVI